MARRRQGARPRSPDPCRGGWLRPDGGPTRIVLVGLKTVERMRGTTDADGRPSRIPSSPRGHGIDSPGREQHRGRNGGRLFMRCRICGGRARVQNGQRRLRPAGPPQRHPCLCRGASPAPARSRIVPGWTPPHGSGPAPCCRAARATSASRPRPGRLPGGSTPGRLRAVHLDPDGKVGGTSQSALPAPGIMAARAILDDA